jgi:hypothetical protein
MDSDDAVHGRSDPKAAANLPAGSSGFDELLHAASEHPSLLLIGAIAGGTTSHSADLPASFTAVDGAGPKAAGNLPGDVPTVDGAGPSPTAGFPANGPAVVDRLHGPLQTS